MSGTEELMFMLELVISVEVVWDVSCGANEEEARGTASVIGNGFNIQGFDILSSFPPRRTQNVFQIYQVRAVRLLAVSDCSCTLYELRRQTIDFFDLQICWDGTATF